MELAKHPLDNSGNELLSTEIIPSLEFPANSSVADEPSTTQLQLNITLEKLRLESSEKERLLELVRLEQLLVSENQAAEERKFRADQAERDRELELVRLEQLRVSEQVAAEQAAEERRFRADQAERDRELEKIRIESNLGEQCSWWNNNLLFIHTLFNLRKTDPFLCDVDDGPGYFYTQAL